MSLGRGSLERPARLFAGLYGRRVCVPKRDVQDRLVTPRGKWHPELGVDRGIDQKREDPAAALRARRREGIVEQRVFLDRDQIVFVLELCMTRFTRRQPVR